MWGAVKLGLSSVINRTPFAFVIHQEWTQCESAHPSSTSVYMCAQKPHGHDVAARALYGTIMGTLGLFIDTGGTYPS